MSSIAISPLLIPDPVYTNPIPELTCWDNLIICLKDLWQKIVEFFCCESPSIEDLSIYNTDIKNTAATKIQTVFRGFRARQQLQVLKQAKLGEQNNAATKIQTGIRGHLARKQLQVLKQNAAVVKVQTSIRGYLARKQLQALKQNAAKQLQALKQNNAAAVKIQTVARGYLACKELHRLRQAKVEMDAFMPEPPMASGGDVEDTEGEPKKSLRDRMTSFVKEKGPGLLRKAPVALCNAVGMQGDQANASASHFWSAVSALREGQIKKGVGHAFTSGGFLINAVTPLFIPPGVKKLDKLTRPLE